MKNNFAVERESTKDGVRHLSVNTTKAVFQRMRWNDLGDWGKKKFENMLFLTRMNDSKEKLKIGYVTTTT